MAADPGLLSDSAAPYHLFLTGIPIKLPKDEVEAILTAELASQGVKVQAISSVPQSAWKNKGYAFVVLAGSPHASDISATAKDLDGNVRVGGKCLSVRVWQPKVSGGRAATPPGPLCNWDQPPEKVARLCAQVLHVYFARRSHQEAFKAEKLLSLLSETVAPSCCQEPKALPLWGRNIYGSLEDMLLAIGRNHFGGSWALTGTVAERDAILSIGKARHMQGWDALRDPLPVTTILRLNACKQRLEDVHTPEASTGFSTPTACRRCSDCGSLSAIHSTEQPSCSQSESSWSFRSLYAAAPASGTHTSSDCSPSLATPSSGSEAPFMSSSVSTAWDYKSLQSCGGIELLDTGQPCRRDPEPPDRASAGTRTPGSVSSFAQSNGQSSCAETASSCSRQTADFSTSSRLRHHRSPKPKHGGKAVVTHSHQQHHPQTHTACGPFPRAEGSLPRKHSNLSPAPPSTTDLLARCARHLERLFSRYPSQPAFPVHELLRYLSEAQDVVAWGSGSQFFSLEGYASAVYGSFEHFLSEISRLYFGGRWCAGGVCGPSHAATAMAAPSPTSSPSTHMQETRALCRTSTGSVAAAPAAGPLLRGVSHGAPAGGGAVGTSQAGFLTCAVQPAPDGGGNWRRR